MSENKNSLIRLIAFYTDKFKELEKDSGNSEKKELIYDTLKLLLELKEYRLKEYLKNIKEERLKKGEKYNENETRREIRRSGTGSN